MSALATTSTDSLPGVLRRISIAVALVAATLALLPASAALAAPDYDGDGATDTDCQPLDPSVHPGAVDVPDVGFEDLNCDGVDGDPTKAFFVSLAGNDDGTGSLAIPFRSISKGIAAATADPVRKSVYITAGTFDTEQVTLEDGVSLYGGYLPNGSRSNDEKTVITRSNSLGVVLADGDVGIELQLLTVNGPNFASSGLSSYAIRAINGSSLTLTSVVATGGTGAAGTPGAPGGTGATGGAGQCGGYRQDCNETPGDGGSGGTGLTGGASGGPGADSPASAGNGADGFDGIDEGALAGGGGGGNGCFNESIFCDRHGNNGGSGNVGTTGTSGANAVYSSNLAGATWLTGSAGNGISSGGDGSGGGGGGSGRTTTEDCGIFGTLTFRGGGGGGGGEGGDGGSTGAAGGAGGGSFGLYLHASTVVVDGGRLAGGAGGAGGDGGNGGTGGAGGAGGPGAIANAILCAAPDPGDGGDGGQGGQGGQGGGGGGGAGGPGAAIFTAGTANAVVKSNVELVAGTASLGGIQGNGGPRAGSGPGAATLDDSDPNAPVGDFDADGKADSDDACPAVAAGATDANADGCPDRAAKLADADGDGIPDSADACPAQAAGAADANGDGCPDPPPGPATVDNDRDGIPVPFDCNDSNAAVRPGVVEVAGNTVDENCDGIAAPFPKLDVGIGNSFAFTRRTTTVKVLEVRRAPAGAKIKVTCKTPKRKRGCAFKSKTLTSKGRTVKLVSLFKKRKLPVGTKITITVTAPSTIGKVVSYTTRKSKAPKVQTLCLPPGARAAQRCV